MNLAVLTPDAFERDELLLLPEQLLLPTGCVREHAVVVRGGRFVRVGPAAAVRAEFPQLAALELPQRLLMPGLIDAHTHLTQSLGKALAFGEPSEIFRRIWVPMEQTLREEAAWLSAKLAALEALRGGFTTVVDAGTRSEEGLAAVARAAHEAGIRCVLARTCNDLAAPPGADPYEPLLRAAEAHLARYEHDPLVHPSLAVSIPEVASDRMLARVSALVREAGRIFQTHANEHLVAVERSLVARGLRPIELLAACDALHASTLLAHATLLTPSELSLLADTGTAVAYNPVASAWKGNAVLDAIQLHERGVPFALGTDGTRYDGFRLLDAAETAQRLAYGLARGDSSCGGGWLWLDHGTHRGARAAGLQGVTGAIAEGLEADFLLLDLDVPEMQPSWDLSWELVRLADRSQIEAVFVRGVLRLWQGWPLAWDARALLQQVRAVAREDIARAPIQRVHPTADEHRRRSAG
ncbi:amidohydrolase family protein [Ramlibacter sp.]|uniref:amidohydrolase family protein n=1 Tax=Ramlibacter sp. TaxID=1917967 RepID=UPI002603A596|nr:amidohydrolase family protein [Ramlibacter sp.]MDB5956181.1 amidohydrolase [Ramlibacter sp.]